MATLLFAWNLIMVEHSGETSASTNFFMEVEKGEKREGEVREEE